MNLEDEKDQSLKNKTVHVRVADNRVQSYMFVFSNVVPLQANNLTFRLPFDDIDIIIDRASYHLLTDPRYKHFLALKHEQCFCPNLIDNCCTTYALKPLKTETEVSQAGHQYKTPKIIGKGSYGSITAYETQNVIEKEYKPTDNTVVKEIGIYMLFVDLILCMPAFYDFNLVANSKKPKIFMEMGQHTLRTIGRLDYNRIHDVISQLCMCLDAFASQGLIHCDLKPDNVITIDGAPRIIDWGLAQIDRSKFQNMPKTYNVGTIGYRAPEIEIEHYKPNSRYGTYNHKVDIFALGGIIFFLLTGYNPPENLLFWQSKQPITEFKENNPTAQQLQDLITGPSRFNDIEETVLMNVQHFRGQENIEEMKFLVILIAHMVDYNPTFRYDYNDILILLDFKPTLYPIFQNNIGGEKLTDIFTEEWLKKRKKVVEWIFKVSNHYKYDTPEITCTTIQIIDLYAARSFIGKPINDSLITLLAEAAYHMAQKIYSYRILTLSELVRLTSYGDSIDNIIAMEKDIIITLQGDFIYPTWYSYYIHYFGYQSAKASKEAYINAHVIYYGLLKLYSDPKCYHILNDVIESKKLFKTFIHKIMPSWQSNFRTLFPSFDQELEKIS